MISKDLLGKYVALSMGSQIKTNHHRCTAGIDTKSRLYIKRVVGGVVGYCHHCNDKGFYRELSPDGTNLRKWLSGKKDGVKYNLHRQPIEQILKEHLSHDYTYNTAALNWLLNQGVGVSETQFYKPSRYGNIIMLLHDIHSHIFGIQQRNFTKPDLKYQTYLGVGSVQDAAFFITSASEHPVLYITEDYTSAYRIHRDTGRSSVALLKTSLSANTEEFIRSLNYSFVYVWLDPDKAGMDGARRIKNRLDYLLPRSTTIINITPTMDKEPKELSVAELKSVVLGEG